MTTGRKMAGSANWLRSLAIGLVFAVLPLPLPGKEPANRTLEQTYVGLSTGALRNAQLVVFSHVREQPGAAQRYGITSIPVQVFFDREGREVFRHTGFYPQRADAGPAGGNRGEVAWRSTWRLRDMDCGHRCAT